MHPQASLEGRQVSDRHADEPVADQNDRERDRLLACTRSSCMSNMRSEGLLSSMNRPHTGRLL